MEESDRLREHRSPERREGRSWALAMGGGGTITAAMSREDVRQVGSRLDQPWGEQISCSGMARTPQHVGSVDERGMVAQGLGTRGDGLNSAARGE